MNPKTKTNPVIMGRAKEMRQNPTKAENVLWQRLRREQLGYKFRRQQPIGRYIVDFYCHQIRLIIEVDGDVHAFQEEYDADRSAWLEAQGHRLVRYSNMDVLTNLDVVVQAIFEICEQSQP